MQPQKDFSLHFAILNCLKEENYDDLKKDINDETLRTFYENNQSPLYLALFHSLPEEIVNLFIVDDILDDQEKITKNTPLHVVLWREYSKDLVEKLITPNNLNIVDRHGNTPLHIASRLTFPKEIIELLITKENLKIKNKQGKTPYQLAAFNKYPEEITKLLLKEEEEKEYNPNLNCPIQ